MKSLTSDSTSLHSIVIRHYAAGTLEEVLSLCRGRDVLELMADDRLADIAKCCVDTLTYRERWVIHYRGLLSGKKQPWPNVARDMALSADKVRCIELSAIKKLRSQSRLGAFIDA